VRLKPQGPDPDRSPDRPVPKKLLEQSCKIFAKKGSKTTGSGQILTRMHGISFASGLRLRLRCGGSYSPPRPLRYQGRGGARRRFEASGTMIGPCNRCMKLDGLYFVRVRLFHILINYVRLMLVTSLLGYWSC